VMTSVRRSMLTGTASWASLSRQGYPRGSNVMLASKKALVELESATGDEAIIPWPFTKTSVVVKEKSERAQSIVETQTKEDVESSGSREGIT